MQTTGPSFSTGRLTDADIIALDLRGVRVVAATPDKVTLRGRVVASVGAGISFVDRDVDVTYHDIRRMGLLAAFRSASGAVPEIQATIENEPRKIRDFLIAGSFIGFALASLIWGLAK